jgi:hypothetical protein
LFDSRPIAFVCPFLGRKNESEAVMRFTFVVLICAAIVTKAACAADDIAPPSGPPPRFLTLEKVDEKKAWFDAWVGEVAGQKEILQYPDGSTREVGGSAYGCISYWIPINKATWFDGEGTRLESESVWKEIKPGSNVLLSADGKPVSPVYLKLLKKDIYILVVPSNLLPMSAVNPFTSSGIIPRKVSE